MDCYGDHLPWFLAATAGLVFYGLAVPFLIFLKLREVRHDLHSSAGQEAQLKRFGFLYNGFEPKYYYFETLYMVRKVALLVAIAIPSVGLRVMYVLFVFFFFVGVHFQCRPYDDRDYGIQNSLDDPMGEGVVGRCR